MAKSSYKRKRIARQKALKEWSLAVRARDWNKCQMCGSIKFLNAHHIISKVNKKLRLDIMNGISLCSKHHRFSFEISAHQNPFAFFLWFMNNKKEQFEYLKEKTNEM